MSVLESLAQDTRYALRSLRNAPVFALVAVASLALGIGANTAIFSLVNSVMLKALPVREPARLVQLTTSDRTTSWTNAIWEAIRDRDRALDGMLSYGTRRLNLSRGGETRYASAILASGGFFEVLGVQPLVGRAFGGQDDRRGCPEGSPAVLSYGFWQSHYGGVPSALGQQIFLDGRAFSVIGVTPPSFFGLNVGQTFDVVLPLCAEAVLRGPDSALDQRSFWWLTVLGRLKPGQTREQAQAALRALQAEVRASTLPADWPAEYQKQYLADPFVASAASGGVSYLRDRYERALLVLLGVVALVLVVACANIATLLLARAAARAKELAVRVSLGATRARLVRQLLVESLLLSLLGAGLGILVALWASRALVALLATETSRVFLDLGLDWRVLSFTAVAGAATGILFGILPALQATRHAPNHALHGASRGTSAGDARIGAGRWLVTAQVGLSLVVLFSAALFIRTYTSLAGLDPGFSSSGVLVVSADIRAAGAAQDARIGVYQQILEALRGLPGVRAAALSAVTPISGSTWQHAIQVDGFTPQGDRDASVHYNYVSPSYFETLGTRLLAGRDIAASDTAASPRVAVVNEALARKFFKDRSPLGRVYRTRERNTWNEVTIVGIARDAKYRNLRDPAPPTAYAPITQLTRVGTSLPFSVRASLPTTQLRAAIVGGLARVHPQIGLTFRSLESQLRDSLQQERLMAALSALFGALALCVAGVGLAGLVSYSVVRRRSELGIRAALGATPGSLTRLVLRDVLFLTALGLAAGTGLCLAAGRLVSSLLYGLQPTDPATLITTAALLATVALAAGYLPARRAARADPLECLRAE